MNASTTSSLARFLFLNDDEERHVLIFSKNPIKNCENEKEYTTYAELPCITVDSALASQGSEALLRLFEAEESLKDCNDICGHIIDSDVQHLGNFANPVFGGRYVSILTKDITA